MTITYVSSGIASGGTIFPNNVISVFASGSTLDLVLSGGKEFVLDGGKSDSTFIKHDGTETVLNNGVSNDTSVGYAGTLNVSAGGVANSSKIHTFGFLYVESGGISSGTININGEEIVSKGGKVIDSTVRAGDQTLEGGISIDTNLDFTHKGGVSICTQTLAAGAISSNTTIGVGAVQNLGTPDEIAGTGDDIAYNTMDSGTENVSSKGKTNDTLILNGGSENVYFSGTSYGTKVSSGTETVSSGGIAIGTKVFNGGMEIVASGGVTSKTTILGGELEMASGGKATGAISFSGPNGELVIDKKAMPTNTIFGFASTDSITLTTIPYSTNDSVSVNAPNLVTISAGGKTYNLHIAGATVGETDFTFGPGSILTRGAAPKPQFLRPAETTSPAPNLTQADIFPSLATNQRASPSAPPLTSKTTAPIWQHANTPTHHQDYITQVLSSHTP